MSFFYIVVANFLHNLILFKILFYKKKKALDRLRKNLELVPCKFVTYETNIFLKK